jgi:hypothetical protein
MWLLADELLQIAWISPRPKLSGANVIIKGNFARLAKLLNEKAWINGVRASGLGM